LTRRRRRVVSSFRHVRTPIVTILVPFVITVTVALVLVLKAIIIIIIILCCCCTLALLDELRHDIREGIHLRARVFAPPRMHRARERVRARDRDVVGARRRM